MIRAFYLVEGATAAGAAVLLVRGCLWVYRAWVTAPGPWWLWLPVCSLVLGWLLRFRGEVSLVSGLVGWHESIRRRMDEGQP